MAQAELIFLVYSKVRDPLSRKSMNYQAVLRADPKKLKFYYEESPHWLQFQFLSYDR